MTVAQFRRMALSFEGAEERAHMGHPDFRAAGKIFATLSVSDKGRGMLKLTPEQQTIYVQRDPDTFVPVKGGWGVGGATSVMLKPADSEIVGEAMTDAWRNVTRKKK